MNRRDFVNKAKIISLGGLVSPSLFFGCEKEDDFEPYFEEETYIPNVNSSPYFERDYYFQKGNGSNPIFSFGEENYKVYFENKNKQLVSNFDSYFYGDKIFHDTHVSFVDPSRKYLPGFLNLSSKKKGISTASVLETKDAEMVSELGDVFVERIKAGLPSWDVSAMCEKQGMLYLGDWSFNNLKQMNTNLNKGSAVITMLAPNPASASIFAVTSKAGVVLDKVDEVIDLINHYTSFNINKDKQRSIYQFPFDQTTIIISGGKDYYCSSGPGDISKLIPLSPGNSWNYKDNLGRNYGFRVKGLKNVNGKDLLSVESLEGVEEYLGFNGDTLNYYGFNHPEVGRMFFEPALKMGDGNVTKGKTYSTSSKVIVENYPEISGEVRENFSCKNIETIVLSNGKPYGRAFKIDDDFFVELSNGEKTIQDSNSYINWYCENVGRVVVESQGDYFELSNSNIEVDSNKKYLDKNFGLFSPYLKIIDKLKTLI
jgi:hypothetical protein